MNRVRSSSPLVLLILLAWTVAAAQVSPFSPTLRTIKELREAAESGNATAQFALANAFLAGEGIPSDPQEAAKWFRKAAEQKDPLSQFALGMMYDEGKGVGRDKMEAARWYRSAAELGLPEAQFNLATCYSKGEGVELDHMQAMSWYRKAADQGDLQAQVAIGLAYRDGKGVDKNQLESVKWLKKAAYQGEQIAQFFLGLAFLDGSGPETNREDGLKWVRRSADQGYAEAQYYLGTAAGLGDPEDAARWLNKAAAQGHEAAKNAVQLHSSTSLLKGATNATGNVNSSRSIVQAGDPGNSSNLAAASPFPPMSGTEKSATDSTGSSKRPAREGAESASSSTAGAPATSESGFGRTVSLIAMTSSLVTAAVAIAALFIFKQRLNLLSRELNQTRRELTKANENLGVMVSFLEKRLAELQAAPAFKQVTAEVVTKEIAGVIQTRRSGPNPAKEPDAETTMPSSIVATAQPRIEVDAASSTLTNAVETAQATDKAKTSTPELEPRGFRPNRRAAAEGSSNAAPADPSTTSQRGLQPIIAEVSNEGIPQPRSILSSAMEAASIPTPPRPVPPAETPTPTPAPTEVKPHQAGDATSSAGTKPAAQVQPHVSVPDFKIKRRGATKPV